MFTFQIEMMKADSTKLKTVPIKVASVSATLENAIASIVGKTVSFDPGSVKFSVAPADVANAKIIVANLASALMSDVNKKSRGDMIKFGNDISSSKYCEIYTVTITKSVKGDGYIATIFTNNNAGEIKSTADIVAFQLNKNNTLSVTAYSAGSR